MEEQAIQILTDYYGVKPNGTAEAENLIDLVKFVIEHVNKKR